MILGAFSASLDAIMESKWRSLGIERLRQHVATLFFMKHFTKAKPLGHVQKFIFLAMARFDRKKLTAVNLLT
jgi:hypothetical protein